MAEYFALIRKEERTSYGVDFPDFPGIVTAGSSLEDARHAAREVLAAHIEFMIEEGEKVPKPSGFDEIMKDRHNRGAVALLVPAPLLRGKAVRANITMDENLLRDVDEEAARRGTTRSALLAESFRMMTGRTVGRGAKQPTKTRRTKKSASSPRR